MFDEPTNSGPEGAGSIYINHDRDGAIYPHLFETPYDWIEDSIRIAGHSYSWDPLTIFDLPIPVPSSGYYSFAAIPSEIPTEWKIFNSVSKWSNSEIQVSPVYYIDKNANFFQDDDEPTNYLPPGEYPMMVTTISFNDINENNAFDKYDEIIGSDFSNTLPWTLTEKPESFIDNLQQFGTMYRDVPWNIAMDTIGNSLYACGRIQQDSTTPGNDTGYITKRSRDGGLIWENIIGPEEHLDCFDVVVDSLGFAYAIGCDHFPERGLL